MSCAFVEVSNSVFFDMHEEEDDDEHSVAAAAAAAVVVFSSLAPLLVDAGVVAVPQISNEEPWMHPLGTENLVVVAVEQDEVAAVVEQEEEEVAVRLWERHSLE